MESAQDNDYSQLPPLELYVEIAPGEGCFCHIPALPGLCFRAANQSESDQLAGGYIRKYLNWLNHEKLNDLNLAATTLSAMARTAMERPFPVALKETRHGSPVWISGNSAALFSYDLYPLDDLAIRAHLRFTRQVLKRIASTIDPHSESQRTQKIDTDHRSINEMLIHIGNCVWWYCSRIDDKLPEPDEPANEEPLRRIERLLDQAEQYLISVPEPVRNLVHIPTRFPTNDPSEQWTHTKVCRRQAEHMWEHLAELQGLIT